jgi:hypothetical protein
MILASGVTVDVNALAVLLTPLAIAVLAFLNNRNARKVATSAEIVAKKVETVKLTAEEARAERKADKQDTDDKLEVIRVDVNSNLTKALNELAELRKHFGVIEGEPLPPAIHGNVTIDKEKL